MHSKASLQAKRDVLSVNRNLTHAAGLWHALHCISAYNNITDYVRVLTPSVCVDDQVSNSLSENPKITTLKQEIHLDCHFQVLSQGS